MYIVYLYIVIMKRALYYFYYGMIYIHSQIQTYKSWRLSTQHLEVAKKNEKRI